MNSGVHRLKAKAEEVLFTRPRSSLATGPAARIGG